MSRQLLPEWVGRSPSQIAACSCLQRHCGRSAGVVFDALHLTVRKGPRRMLESPNCWATGSGGREA